MKNNIKKTLWSICILILLILLLYFLFKPANRHSTKIHKDKVKIQLSWFPGSENAFMFYGMEKGIFDSLNIEIEWKPSKGSSIVATGLANNEFDFGFISSDYVIVSKNKGLPIKAIMTLYHETPVTIFSLKEKNIKKPSDLKGKKLGVLLKSSAYPQVIAFLKLNGVHKDIDFTEVPVSGTMVEILNNKVDAMMHFTNYGPAEIVGRHKKEINEIKLKDNNVSMYGTCIAVNETFAKENNDIVERFIKGCLLSLERAKLNHNEALNALLKYSPNSDKDEFNLALLITEKMIYDSLTIHNGLGYMSTEGWQKTVNQVQLLNNEIFKTPVEDLFTTKYLK